MLRHNVIANRTGNYRSHRYAYSDAVCEARLYPSIQIPIHFNQNTMLPLCSPRITARPVANGGSLVENKQCLSDP
eukprot:jgi/Psemu1/308288/fgenesh1_kg.395_\